MEIKRASEMDDNVREKISEIFVDGFSKDFRSFSRNNNTLIKAFAHMFVLDVFYVAIMDNEIAGIMACTNMQMFCIKHNKKIFIKYFGIIKGLFLNSLFRYYFQKLPKYPIETNEKTASIEFVATLQKFRGKGVASSILKYLHSFPEYEEYILEVADINLPAIKLYEKMGYKEVYRKKEKYSKYSGINYLLYMKYNKENIK
jgi:ribosomal protein S18 acetylase RimI-like enzyme